MMTDLARYIVNPGPKKPVTGLKAAVTTDSAIVTETMVKVLKNGGNAADAGIAGALVQAAVEPFMTNHAGLVTFLYYEAKTGQGPSARQLGRASERLAAVQAGAAQHGQLRGLPAVGDHSGIHAGLERNPSQFGTRQLG